MNSSDICHEILDCPGLYVDAFRGRFLRRTQDPDAVFILTHYHGDHYQNLPREGKYQGPALIHCTPVTAALLIRVHQVPAMFVVEHDYGQTFEYNNNIKKGQGQGGGACCNAATNITFYDANHCPGACIVLIQLPNTNGTGTGTTTTHLHTGDMRYHEKFQSYPLLQEAVLQQTLDLVYLDTTYSHPKHDFAPQEDAVEAIASQVSELLCVSKNDTRQPQPQSKKTLVLLSCYSIGKEKVLWEAATRTNQLVYVSERKWQMLQCVEKGQEDISSQIIHRCTQDPSASDIHVIPMGLAGEIWPFFRPNFQKCADYVQELETSYLYDKVVAFLPTGWANATKWNKEHAVSQKTVEFLADDDGKSSLEVEVRLIPYSEHSAFSELVAFVEYLKPRKVIPTVFSDDADLRNIQGRFRNLLDSTRAKQAFFRSMATAATTTTTTAAKKPIAAAAAAAKTLLDDKDPDYTTQACASKEAALLVETSIIVIESDKQQQQQQQQQKPDDNTQNTDSDDSEIQVVKVSRKRDPTTSPQTTMNTENVDTLVAMGFDKESAKTCLRQSGNNLDTAIEMLLSKQSSGKQQQSAGGCRSSESPHHRNKRGPENHFSSLESPSTPSVSAGKKQRPSPSSSLITKFFSKK